MPIALITRDYPATSEMPGSPRPFCLTEEIARSVELLLIVVSPTPARKQQFLESVGQRSPYAAILEVSAPVDEVTFLRRQAHRLRNEPHFSSRSRQPEQLQSITQQIRKIVESRGITTVLIDGLSLTQYIELRRPPCRVIVDLCDCLSRILSQQLASEKRPLERIRITLEHRAVQRWEKYVLQSAAHVLCISEHDRDALLSIVPGSAVEVVANGVDTNYFGYQEQTSDSDRLLFTGVMSYPPNEDAAQYFSESVLPLVRESFPDTIFTIVGPDPSPRLRQLAGPSLVVTGLVPDIRPYLAQAAAFVCPLRLGSGVKNKLLVAMASGVPVIATRRSLEGIPATDRTHLLIADSPSEFLAAIAALRTDSLLREKLRMQARQLVELQFSWKAQAELLRRILESN